MKKEKIIKKEKIMKKEVIKPFSLEAYNKGAKIKTRDGRKVRIICTNAECPHYPIVALVKLANDNEVTQFYTSKGTVYKDCIDEIDLIIVEEVEEPEFWSDNKNNTIHGFSINNVTSDGIFTEVDAAPNIELNYDIFTTKKQAKSALAMARISQIMANDVEHFGGVVTDDEWENNDYKYVIHRASNNIRTMDVIHEYHFLAFHTIEQRALFLKKYRDLVKEYLMID